MEDLKKKINFDPALLYYSTPKENGDELSKPPGLNVETYNSRNRKHICVICGKRFFTSNSLQTHMANHSSEELVTASKEKDENADLKNRFVSSKGERCKKNNCNFIALDSVDYSKHIPTCEGVHLTKENSSAFCELCDCYFSSKNYFQAHSLLQHPENDPNITLKDDDVRNTKISDPVSLYVLENSCGQESSVKSSTSLSMYPDSVVTKKKSKNADSETSQPTNDGTIARMINGNETESVNFCSETSTVNENNKASNTYQKTDRGVQDVIIPENNLNIKSRMNTVTDSVVNVQQSNNSKEIIIVRSVVDQNETEEVKQNSTEKALKSCSQSELSNDLRTDSLSENLEISNCTVDTTVKCLPITTQESDGTNNVNVKIEDALETKDDNCKSSQLGELMVADDSAQISLQSDEPLIEELPKKDDQTMDEMKKKLMVANDSAQALSQSEELLIEELPKKDDQMTDEMKKDFDDQPPVKDIPIFDEVSHQSSNTVDNSVEKLEICEKSSVIDGHQSDISASTVEKKVNAISVPETSSDVVKAKTSDDVEAKTSSDVEAMISSDAEAKTSSGVEAKTSSDVVEAKTSSDVETKTSSDVVEAKTSSDVETKTSSDVVEAKTSSDAVEAKTSSDVEAKTSSDVEADTSSDVEAETSSDVVEAKTSNDVEAKTSSDVQAKTSSDVEAKTSSDVEAKTSSDVQTKTSSDVQAKASSDVQAKTSNNVIEDPENSASKIIKDKLSSTLEEVIKIPTVSDTSAIENIQKLKDIVKQAEKKNSDVETNTVGKGKEINSSSDSCQGDENNCSATSNPSFEMVCDKRRSKKSKNLSQAIKSYVVHSTSKEEPSNDISTTFTESDPAGNVHVNKYKRISVNSDDLNVKQRSVRQRKKLILPDYEYGLDHKADFSDSSATENTSLLCGGEPVKKRGRPRKKPIENAKSDVVNPKKPKPSKVKNEALFSSSKSPKNSEENDEQAEEFCLNTTINESESDAGFNDSCPGEISFNDSKMEEEILHEEEDDKNDEIHSWLKKVDFSEQSAFDSWYDKPPKKRLGRPPKKKKPTETLENLKNLSRAVENSVKMVDVSNKNSNIILKKKKGRPLKFKKKLNLLSKKQKQLIHWNLKEGVKTNLGISPKKRGRPSKIKSDCVVTNLNEIQSPDAVLAEEVIPNTAKVQTETGFKVEKSDKLKLVGHLPQNIARKKKKRGRPRKTDVRFMKTSTSDWVSEAVGDTSVLKSEPENKSINDPVPAKVQTIEAQSSLSNTDLHVKKQDDPKPIGSSPPPRKRGRPSKQNAPNIPENETLLSDRTSPPRKESSESKNLSSKNFIISENNQEIFIDKSDKEWKPPKHSLLKSLKTKATTQNHSVAEDKSTPDETIKIDEALYYADLKSKSRFSRVFKKPVISSNDQSENEVIVCGRCEKKMTRRHYLKYHQIAHYYLCWLEGEPKINLNDDIEIGRIIQSYVNPDALKKKAIRLACELCDKIMKSVVGYVSHVRFCQKKDEKELLEKCSLCTKLLKPSSIRHHYLKFHGVSKFITTSDSKIIPVTCAETKTEEILPFVKKNSLLGFERVPVQKVDILNDEHFWKSLKTSYDLYMCMGLSCRHMTMGKDDLKTHILCCTANFCEFSCSSCPYKTKYESEIIYHAKKKCKETSDSEDNAEEKTQPSVDRRISTRVKKRKHVFDYDDCTESERKKSRKQKDDEFILSDVGSNGDSNGSDFSDSDDSATEYKDRREKKSRFSRKKTDNLLNKSSEEGGFRQAFLYHSSTRNFDPLNWTVDVRLKTYSSCPVHLHLGVDINEWETFPISDLPKYSPLQHKSPKASFEGSQFAQFKLFDSDVVKGVPVCYTGGPVWAMAWAPLPAQVTEQYLAVAGLQHMNHVIDLSSPVEFPSLIQIWKFSSLDNISNDIHAPTLAWAVAHNFGAVLCMEWCPSGGFDNSSTPYRLGILALATSSGCCVIYSMPRLDCGGETRSIVANPNPDLILRVRYDNVQCTRIVWKKNNQPNIIYGGFSDGSIALWNISSTSSILKKGKTLYPFRTFEAHTSPITALDVHWLDNCRFMVTSASDRIVKYWDLEDLSGPMYEHELSNSILNAVWMHHWVVTANAMDFINGCEPLSAFSHPRDLVEKRKPILCIKDTFWSVAYSDWNDTIAVASQGGCVSVSAAKHMSALSWKQPDFEKIVTQTSLILLAEEDKDKSESIEESTGLPPTNDEYDCSPIIEKNGLKFLDRIKVKPNPENLNYSIAEPNIVSVNKVCWNQNYNSFNWIAIGYECGFVRVVRVERFDKCHLTKFYKMNENNNITLI